MALVGGNLAVVLLNGVTRNGTVSMYPDEAPAYKDRSKLEVLFGPDIWENVRGRTVLDFGCGKGAEAIEVAARGALRVIGLDIRNEWLDIARRDAAWNGLSSRCTFVTEWHEPVDTILSLDAFEHFADPLAILREMDRLLADNGRVHISFGPTWFHPLGGHLFSVFPWAHLVFTERALMRWRSLYKTDGAATIEEAGLNRMTIGRFRRVVAKSPFTFEAFEAVPIRRLRRLHSALTREFTTAIVRCTLVKRRR